MSIAFSAKCGCADQADAKKDMEKVSIPYTNRWLKTGSGECIVAGGTLYTYVKKGKPGEMEAEQPLQQ